MKIENTVTIFKQTKPPLNSASGFAVLRRSIPKTTHLRLFCDDAGFAKAWCFDIQTNLQAKLLGALVAASSAIYSDVFK
ncbi:hypothetical protein [Synechococcus sp. PROS-U-1]|uniref:hypothetical protein n=1 Tax=Synechococcus sp. PROS-U-1 TaxID=1400866 RepID=UPI00164583B5|nr:hypothetical protein [Synechococcus sp. PROS-U-1]QNJ03677.1 hypothetical protein SynPROSU1_02081 [Synechococcus sp. PROS-U-1]